MALAKKFGIKVYPTPAGGCALTQKGFVNRLKELMKNKPDFNAEDIDLIRFGRHFYFDNIQIILGRNQQENQILESVFKKNNTLIEPENFIGPTAILRGKKIDEPVIKKAKKLIIKFSPKVKNLDVSQLTFRIDDDK